MKTDNTFLIALRNFATVTIHYTPHSKKSCKNSDGDLTSRQMSQGFSKDVLLGNLKMKEREWAKISAIHFVYFA